MSSFYRQKQELRNVYVKRLISKVILRAVQRKITNSAVPDDLTGQVSVKRQYVNNEKVLIFNFTAVKSEISPVNETETKLNNTAHSIFLRMTQISKTRIKIAKGR